MTDPIGYGGAIVFRGSIEEVAAPYGGTVSSYAVFTPQQEPKPRKFYKTGTQEEYPGLIHGEDLYLVRDVNIKDEFEYYPCKHVRPDGTLPRGLLVLSGYDDHGCICLDCIMEKEGKL